MLLLYNSNNYPNLLDLIKLTHNEIQEQIAEYKLTFPKIRNYKVEWEIRFPSFVRAFYGYIYKIGRIPTQEKFYNFYIELNKSFFIKNTFSDDMLLALKARLYRMYPSLVRDIHFNLYLKENLQDYLVIYNINLDMENDIDILIKREDICWALSLFTNTRRGKSGRKVKEKRHQLFNNIRYYEVPIDLSSCKTLGDFMLYGENEYKKILSIIQ